MGYRLLIFLCFFCYSVLGQSVKFNNIGVQDGLSNSWVKSIHKDNRGFIWFGTLTGLNRYDGYKFKVFKHDPSDAHSLEANDIATIYEDSQERLWVSNTNIGYVHLYNPEEENFRLYKLPGIDQNANMGHVAIDKPILEDSKGNLWVGTEFGLAIFDADNNEFVEYPVGSFNQDMAPISAVYSIVEDSKGLLWLGTSNGLVTHDYDQKTTKAYVPSEEENSLSHPLVRAIHEDENGAIWLGTWGGGLHLYQPATDDFKRFLYDPYESNTLSENDILSLDGNDDGKLFIGTENGGLDILDLESLVFEHNTTEIDYNFSLSSNSIYSIFYDTESQILWLGTFNGGVNYISKWSKPFINHKAQLTKLNNNKVTALLKDNTENLYIGTDGGGLNVRSSIDGSYAHYRHDDINPNSLMSDAVLAILEDSDLNLWVGTYDGGIDLFNRASGDFRHFRHDEHDAFSLGGIHVSSLCEDQDGNIWAGTFDAGVSVMKKETNEFVTFRNDSTDASLSNNFVQGVFTDSKGDIYVSTMVTLDIYQPETQTFRRFDKERLMGVRRTIVAEDSKGFLWIGSENGLYKYDQQSKFLAHYTTKDGLPDNNISGILEDEEKNLWLSTHNGLVKFDPNLDMSDKPFRSYSVTEGLQGAEFKIGAYFKGSDGIMYFGGQNGYNSFDPAQVLENPNIPPVVITELKVFNKTVRFGDDEVIPKPILLLDELQLDYKASVFTLEYAALGYTLPEGNTYAFIMEGFEDDWNYVGNQRAATYTNLDAGDYVFRVKAANNDGAWNEKGRSLKIKVLPPFYNTWWFRAIVLVFCLSLLALFNRTRTLRVRRNQRELEIKVNQRTKELKTKNEELAKMSAEKEKVQEQMWHSEKMAALGVLTAGVAHEINNPTGFIKAGMEVFKKETAKSTIDHDTINELITHMDLGVARITEIVKSLNAFSRDDEKSMSECEVHAIIDDCLTILHHQYKDRIEIKKKYHENHLLTKGNSSQLYQVFTNLLSNSIQAIKSTGTISIATKIEAKMICVTVSDTGTGIPKEYLTKVFDPFFTTKDAGVGTGLGLSIVYNIIERHKGRIVYNSTAGKGTTATVYLKLLEPEKS